MGTAAEANKMTPEYSGTIPGEIVAPAFGLRLRIEVAAPAGTAGAAAEEGGISSKPTKMHPSGAKAPNHFIDPTYGLKPVPFTEAGLSAGSERRPRETGQVATLRNWRPGDRVTLRHSGGPRKVKEVLERLRVTGSGRALWPVLEAGGRILWMQGVEVEPEDGIHVAASPLEEAAPKAKCPEPAQSEASGNG